MGAEHNTRVGAEHNTRVGAEHSTRVGAEHNTRVGAEHSTRVGAEHNTRVGAELGAEHNTRVGAELGAEHSTLVGAEHNTLVMPAPTLVVFCAARRLWANISEPSHDNNRRPTQGWRAHPRSMCHASMGGLRQAKQWRSRNTKNNK